MTGRRRRVLAGALGVLALGFAIASSTSAGAAPAGHLPRRVRAAATRPVFAPTIVQAMRLVARRARLPLLAPTSPGFSAYVRHLGAQVATYAHGDAYSVILLATPRPLPVNSPALSALAAVAMNLVGTFGGVRYPSAAAARADGLLRWPAESLAPAYQPPPHVAARRVLLGRSMVGTLYAAPTAGAAGTPMVLWHEGEWTLEVWDGTAAQDLAQARALVAYLDKNRLPESEGVLGENIAGDGDHTTAAWQMGDTVYSCFNNESGVGAAEMAVSERVFPSGAEGP